jgi:SAM-dependent methyltransferase
MGGSAALAYLPGMLDAFIYDFGYAWPWAYGHLIAAVIFASLALAGWRYRWRFWKTLIVGVLALWALTGSFVVHHVARFNRPNALPTERFLTSGTGRVLDLGAGSGRSALMVLLSRPHTTVTALDLYSGYFGIVGNTPERLMANARIAGVAERVDAKIGDMRSIPLPDGSYDAIVSVAAIDHLRVNDVKKTLVEAARVLKPHGELLLINVNVDIWIRTAFPWMHGHGYFGRPQDIARWVSLIDAAGFEMIEHGTRPATMYFLARKGEQRSGDQENRRVI